jgi:hypothetical protein
LLPKKEDKHEQAIQKTKYSRTAHPVRFGQAHKKNEQEGLKMTVYSIFAVDGSEQIINEPEFNGLRNTERFFEYAADEARALFPYGIYRNKIFLTSVRR